MCGNEVKGQESKWQSHDATWTEIGKGIMKTRDVDQFCRRMSGLRVVVKNPVYRIGTSKRYRKNITDGSSSTV